MSRLRSSASSCETAGPPSVSFATSSSKSSSVGGTTFVALVAAGAEFELSEPKFGREVIAAPIHVCAEFPPEQLGCQPSSRAPRAHLSSARRSPIASAIQVFPKGNSAHREITVWTFLSPHPHPHLLESGHLGRAGIDPQAVSASSPQPASHAKRPRAERF